MKKHLFFLMAAAIIFTVPSCGDDYDFDDEWRHQEKEPEPDPEPIDTEYDYSVIVGDKEYELKQEGSSEIYSAVVNFTSDTEFDIAIEQTPYGFLSYSGNGGVGLVNNNYSTYPYYNLGGYFPNTVAKSVGRLGTGEEANKLWVNTGSGGKVLVRLDLSNVDGIPRYYLELQDADASNVVLKQNFDLFSWGGQWMTSSTMNRNGSGITKEAVKVEEVDGTEVCQRAVMTYTTMGTNYISSDTESHSVYLANRLEDGWYVHNIYEMPGYIRLSTSSSDPRFGIVQTPPLNKLTGATNITVEFDVCSFAADGFLDFIVDGPGTITSATWYHEDSPTPSPVNTDHDYWPRLSSYEIPKKANADLKFFTHFTVKVQGATSETKLRWDTESANPNQSNSSVGRFCLDNILVTK